jgi:transposase
MTVTTSMAQSAQGDQLDDQEVVLGVDTHRDVHVAVALTGGGRLVASAEFPTTAAGYRAMLSWASGFGTLRRAGIECTGSYGAALSRFLVAEDVRVIEVNQPNKATRRRRGKTDTIDAESAARAVLNGEAQATAKTGNGPVEAMRLLKLARDSAVNASTKAINQLKSIIVGADPQLRESLTGLSSKKLIRHLAQLPDPDGGTQVDASAVYTLRLLARRVLALKAEAYDLHKRIKTLVAAHRPELLKRTGVGPDSAAALLICAGDNPSRMRSETSYAALCGVSPVEASSGNTQRRRLNRGGDRQANAALYRIAQSRLRFDPATCQYFERRTTQGKTRKEIIRCLKRYIARELFAVIHNGPPSTLAT